MIEGEFGGSERSEAVGFSHSDFCFVVEPLDDALENSFRARKQLRMSSR